MRSWGRKLVDRKVVEAPGGFVSGRPRAVLQFWFCNDFRCGVLLFMVIFVIYKYEMVEIVIKC